MNLFTLNYSGTRIIRKEIREHFVRINKENVHIFHVYIKTNRVNGKYAIVQIRNVQIIWDVRISEGQIIRANCIGKLKSNIPHPEAEGLKSLNKSLSS